MLALFTVVGTPTALAILIGIMPVLALLGYLVAAIFVGQFVVDKDRTATHPYAAAAVGSVILMVVNLIPVIGGIVSFLGVAGGGGALALVAWRTFRNGRSADVDDTSDLLVAH